MDLAASDIGRYWRRYEQTLLSLKSTLSEAIIVGEHAGRNQTLFFSENKQPKL